MLVRGTKPAASPSYQYVWSAQGHPAQPKHGLSAPAFLIAVP